jgi:hypothetical protein
MWESINDILLGDLIPGLEFLVLHQVKHLCLLGVEVLKQLHPQLFLPQLWNRGLQLSTVTVVHLSVE